MAFRANLFEIVGSGDLKYGISDEEYSRREAENRRAQAELRFNRRNGEADVDPIEERDDIKKKTTGIILRQILSSACSS
jgi:hypothetical protein